MNSFAEFILQALPGATAGAVLIWLLRGWISERLKQSISHEYSQKLESHKNELELRVQAFRHDYEVHQLRTSLFFDHQRNAFAELLAKMVEINQEWWRLGYDDELGFTECVPYKLVEALREIYYRHQLFLDKESAMGLELLLDVYQESYPFEDGAGDLHAQNIEASYNTAKYLQTRLAAIFQNKIGVTDDTTSIRQVALLGAIRMLNHYHFSEIELPVRGTLKVEAPERPAHSVLKAEQNIELLEQTMRQFQTYLNTETTSFHDAETRLAQYLAVLESK